MATVNISLDCKKLIKWLTITLIATLFVFASFGTKIGNVYQNCHSIAWEIIQGALFSLRDAGWLYVLMMLASPVAMHFTKGMSGKQVWLIRVIATFLGFLGALLLAFVWTKNDANVALKGDMIGTWIYMITSAALCGIIVYDGKDYFMKK
ncbi:MAG: hypothetical protein IIW77_03635 [Bacteroidaceae bacterium]|nr:hypothetical protein [Bacteroidaceae bacterium]